MALRLIKKPSSFSFRSYEDNFKMHQYIQVMHMKARNVPLSNNRLPPVDIYNKTILGKSKKAKHFHSKHKTIEKFSTLSSHKLKEKLVK